MINNNKLQEWIKGYKNDFVNDQWPKEEYKWQAIKTFQDNWDINAEDFPQMLSNSLNGTYNLLDSVNNFPKKMILIFAEMEPETVRGMFRNLYDESKGVFERIKEFKDRADEVLSRWEENNEKSNKSHYQRENPISVYLWLRYPDTHYIYKYSEIKAITAAIDSDFAIKKGAYESNIENYAKLYDEIRTELKKDNELIDMFKNSLNKDDYSDPEYITLAIDLGFYISRNSQSEKTETEELEDSNWWPSLDDYDPDLSKEDWIRYINEVEHTHKGCMGMLKALVESGGEASCKTLSEKFGGKPTAYVGFAVNIGRRAKKYFNLPPCMDGEVERFFPVPFVGKVIDGFYTYRIRPELLEALKEIDLTGYSSQYYAEEETDVRYWWLNASPKIWSFSELKVGEEQAYTLVNENGHKRRIYQNFLDAKPGDLVIGYESHPVKQIVALAKVTAEQDGEKIYFEKVEGLSNPIDFADFKNAPELAEMEYLVNPQGSLFRLTTEEYEYLMDLIRESNPIEQKKKPEDYDEKKFLSEVYMNESRYKTLVSLLENKKNIILQGAPGVGKTFTARRLAYSMMKKEDDSRIEFVQFHQNYSYEDFMMGYKPAGETFELQYGIFYRFCQKAANNPEKDYFFIIDEINRGNLSKIFGELLMLIEKDYRGTKATLAYNGMPFSVPENLYIIGMMNTADRSLAMIDYALRRRFSFFEIEPGFDSAGFKDYQNKLNDDTFNELIDKVKDLNKEIRNDRSLGKGFCIGHSYFCGKKAVDEDWLKAVVNYDILPMLEEYWFDDESKVKKWDNILNGVFE